MDGNTLDNHIERQLECLRREFANQISAGHVTAVGEAWFERLRADARIDEFIPLLGYRFAREELRRCGREDLSRAA